MSTPDSATIGTMPDSPPAVPPKRKLPDLPAGLLDDPRRVVALLALAVGVGLIVGFKLAGGVEKAQSADTAGPYHPPDQPCASCRERELQRARIEAARQQVVGAKVNRDAEDQPPPPQASGPAADGTVFDHRAAAPPRPPVKIDLPPEQ